MVFAGPDNQRVPQHAARPLQGPASQGMSAGAHWLATSRLDREGDAAEHGTEALPGPQEHHRKRTFDEAVNR